MVYIAPLPQLDLLDLPDLPVRDAGIALGVEGPEGHLEIVHKSQAASVGGLILFSLSRSFACCSCFRLLVTVFLGASLVWAFRDSQPHGPLRTCKFRVK